MGRSSPLVSVIIPTYDRPQLLQRAVDSVLDQVYEPIELIVVDDHSPTPVQESLAQLERQSIESTQVLRHAENRGLSAARNTGITSSSGEYIAFLDDDDRWHPEKLSRQVPVLERDPEVGIVTCCLASVSPEGDILRCERDKPSGDLSQTIFRKNVIGSPSRVLIRSACFDEIGLFDEDLSTKQDWDLYIRICQEWMVRCLEEILCFRTIHLSMSSDPSDTERDLLRIRERYQDRIEASGMWEASMAAYHRKVGVMYLFAGDRTSGRHHLRRVLEYERNVSSMIMLLLGMLPHRVYLRFIGTKRWVERSVYSCSNRIPITNGDVILND